MPKATPAALAAAKKELPSNWEARNVKGRIVFINHTTRTTQWDMPKIAKSKGGKTRQSPLSTPTPVAPSGPNGQGVFVSTGGESEAGESAPRFSGGTFASGSRLARTRPGGAAAASPGAGDAVTDPGSAVREVRMKPLPPGWESKVIQGKVVYIDHVNKRTTFERPTSTGGSSQAPHRGTEAPQTAHLTPKVPSPSAAEQLDSSDATDSNRRGGHAADPIYASNTSVAKSSGGDSPLPPGWSRSATPQGEVYYVNHVKKTTTWAKPQWSGSDRDDEPKAGDEDRANSGTGLRSTNTDRSRADGPGSAQVYEDPPLPPGWEERMSAEGKVFYIDHNNKTTHWTRPDPPSTPRMSRPTAEDMLLSEMTKLQVVDRASPSAAPLSPFPEGRSDDERSAVSSVSDLAPDASLPAGSGDPFAGQNGAAAAGRAREAERSVAAAAAAARKGEPRRAGGMEFELEEVAGANGDSYPAILSSERQRDRGAKAEAAEPDEAGDVEGTSDGGGGDPGRAPSATVEATTVAPEDREVPTSRSMEAPSLEISADDAEGERPGPVSSIVKSGLFGATVSRSNSPTTKGLRAGTGMGGDDSPMATKPNNKRSASDAADDGGVRKAPADVAAALDEQPDPQDAPLPEGWTELKTPGGKVYYQNSITRTTQWNRPAPPKPVSLKSSSPRPDSRTFKSTPSPAVGGPAAEAGWEKAVTDDGRPYYQNNITKKTSWQKPDGWVDSGADASIEAKSSVAAHGSFFKSASSSVDVKALGVEAVAETPAVAVAPTPIGRSGGVVPVVSTAAGDAPEEAEEAPLPPGWEKLYTEDGIPFWTNHNEKTTSWDPPPSVRAPGATATATATTTTTTAADVFEGHSAATSGEQLPDSEAFESVEGAVETAAKPAENGTGRMPQNLGADGRPLPEGWEMQTTDQGVPYYVDHINKRTSWDPPVMSSGGMSVIASELPDIPPAELVPDSADLYMGADLLNRFFSSWTGDTQGKSPLEAARNVIVAYLTGPGLKVTKGRNLSSVQRFLYLSPTNKQVVWATKATSKGKHSKKGLTLDGITALHSEEGGIRVEARGEATPLMLKSAAVESLSSEGATILLGVLLADMTGTMLKLQGVNGEEGSCYYPASFVNDVLRVREERMEKNAALAAGAIALEEEETDPNPQQSLVDNGSNGAAAASSPRPATADTAVEAPTANPEVEPAAAAAENPGPVTRSVDPSDEPSVSSPSTLHEPNGQESTAPPAADASVSGSEPAVPAEMGTLDSPSVAVEPPAASKSSPDASSEGGAADERAFSGGRVKDVAAMYMAHISKGAQRSFRELKAKNSSAAETSVRPTSDASDVDEENEDQVPAPMTDAAPSSSALAEKVVLASSPSLQEPGAEICAADLPEQDVAQVGEEDGHGNGDAISPKEDVEPSPEDVSEPAVEEDASPKLAAEGSTVDEDEVDDGGPVIADADAAAVSAEEDGGEDEDEEEDEEVREYRSVLIDMLRPVKMEKYVENFLSSGITLDILPLVERADLQSEVGISGAVPQLKIMKAIKTRFPNGV